MKKHSRVTAGGQPGLRAIARAVSILMISVATPLAQAAGGNGGGGGFDFYLPGGIGGVFPGMAGMDGNPVPYGDGTGGGGGARGAAGGRGGVIDGQPMPVPGGGTAGVGPGGHGGNGSNGVFDDNFFQSSGGGGGGGGADGVVLGTAPVTISTYVQGGFGGKGGDGGLAPTGLPNDYMGGGGGGGGGGYGLIHGGGGAIAVAGVSVFGGLGGNGGNGGGSKDIADTVGAGAGGDGGVGMSVGSATTVHVGSGALVFGGNGGAGGRGGDFGVYYYGSRGGNGGKGGNGMELANGSTLINEGIVRGGQGGVGGAGGVNGDASTVANGTAGSGGTGVVGSNLTIVNKGIIYSGGADVAAVRFTGGTNRFEHWRGSSVGPIDAYGTSDTFVLAGDDGLDGFLVSRFDVGGTYRGFEHFEKIGGSVWTLTGTTSATTSWQIHGGTLAISTDAGLGAAGGTLGLDGGTLQTGATLSTGRATTLGTGGGTFEVTSGVFAHNGVIDGPGSLTKTGAGTMEVNGVNTFAGGTHVNGGILVANVPGALGSSGPISADGSATLQMKGGFDLGGRQIENRGGYIELYDAGTLGNAQVTNYGGYTYLLGSSTAADATIVNSGGIMSFQDGSSGGNSHVTTHSGSLTEFRGWSTPGNAVLVANAGGTVDFSGTNGPAFNNRLTAASIAGAGRFLLGRNQLTVGSDNSSTTVSGMIEDGGPGGGTGGGLVKIGAGTLTLAGTNTYTGATQVNGGTLVVNGSVAGAVDIYSGATLAGNGSVGSTVIAAGGTLAPGNSIGTLTVNGDLRLDAGSTYLVEADPDSSAGDRVLVTGTATLGGAVLHVGPEGNFASTRRYSILTAGAMQGRFASVSSNYAFLDPTLTYGANEVTLALQRKQVVDPVSPADPGTGGGDGEGNGGTGGGVVRPIRFADAAVTNNQRAVANALESLPDSNALHEAIVTLPAGAPPAVFNSLSGEAHASVTNGLMTLAGGARAVPLTHLRDNLSAGLLPGAPIAQLNGPLPAAALPVSAAQPLWVEVLGNWQTFDGDGNAARVRQQAGGFYLGGDGAVGNGWRIGGAFGYANSTLRVDDRSSRAITDSYSATLYGGRAFAFGGGKLKWLFGTAYSWHDADTDRQASLGSGMAQSLSANYHASTAQVFTEASFAMPVSAATQLEPYAGVAWSDTRTRSFAETGGSAALHSPGDRNTLTTTTLGLRSSTRIQLGDTDVAFYAGAGWRHAFGDVNPSTTLAFDGSQPFTVTGAPIARNAALAELRADVAISRTATLGLRYTGQLGGGNRDHTGTVGVRWRF